MNNARPMSGVRVVDFTMYAAGPCCGRVLAYLGADVIKIEPLSGDVWRYSGPICKAVATEDENPLFDSDNIGKRCIAVNLKTEEGKNIVYKLLENADILITNYREEALKKLGLAYEDLKEKFPKLVYGHVDGYGEKGPDAGRPGYDVSAYMARSGILKDFTEPGAPPMTPMGALGDHSTGIFLTAGVLGAYIGAQRTGKGEKVTASLYHGAIWTLTTLLIGVQYGDEFPKSRYNPSASPINHTYRCKDDQWLVIMALDMNKHWPALCSALGVENLLQEEKYSTIAKQKENQEELIRILEGVFETKTFDEWNTILDDFDVPHERVCHMKDVVKDEQALANNFLSPVEYSTGKTVYLSTPPFKLSETGDVALKAAPRLGENTVDILKELGYSSEEIERIKENKIVKAR